MAHTVAITNQKGGVGKTTTAVNLAAAIALAGRRTLLVDADPQGNTTSGVGIAKLELQLSLYDALVEDHPVHDVILPVPGLPHLWVLPATQDLVGAELQLVERPFREAALRRILEPLEREYDYIVVDCPPSLGLLTLNVLAAVQALIIPIQCEYYGLEGISQLLNTVRLVQQNINPGLAIGGVLLTMYDSRLNLCRQVAEDATEYFGPKVFGTPIPRNVRLAEAPSFGKPILLYDMHSVGAKSYLAVAQELLRRVEGSEVTIAPAQVSAAAHAAGGSAAATSVAGAETESEEASASDAGAIGLGHNSPNGATDSAGIGADAAGGSVSAPAEVPQASEHVPPAETAFGEAHPAASQAAESQAAEAQAGESEPGESRPSKPSTGEPPADGPHAAEYQAPEDPATEPEPPGGPATEPPAFGDQPAEAQVAAADARVSAIGKTEAPEGWNHEESQEGTGPRDRAEDGVTPAIEARPPGSEVTEAHESASQPEEPATVAAPHASTDAMSPSEVADNDETKRSSPVLPDA